MSSKDKENKSFQDKMKQFFRKGATGSFKPKDFALTEDIKRELSIEAPIATRTKAIKELSEAVLVNKLEERSIEKLWIWLQDLLHKDQPTELRHLVLYFLQCLLKGQNDRLGMLRAHFFRVIKLHDHPEDVGHRFELLQCLTDNGKDILYFEEEVGPFLLNWLPDITKAGKILDYLGMLINVIKFNAAYIDEETIARFVHNICTLCCTTNQQPVVQACLQIMDTIVAYSNLPPDSLSQFIGALCRTVNDVAYCQNSWRIMRNLLGTHMGHSAMYTMCRILQEPALKNDSGLIRGAVFYINMGLWGTQPLPNLRCTPNSVLPSILQAVQSNQPAVTYEVILCVQRLINKQGHDLLESSWNIILNILSIIIKQVEAAPNQIPNNLVIGPLHETLTTIEHLIDTGRYNGSETQFFELIEECVNTRPENSVLRLVLYLSESIMPTRHLWLTNLNNLLHKYFKPDVRTNIRLKVLEILSNVVMINRMQYEDELLDRIVIPHMLAIVNDSDIVVRSAVAKLLIELCLDCDSKRCLEMLDILEKLLNRPFEQHPPDNIPINESEFCDVKCVVAGLIQVFTAKIHRLPSSHAIRIYKMLVNHLDIHYTRPKVFENCSEMRLMIFDCFMKIRADPSYRLGCMDSSGNMRFSSYLCVTYSNSDRGPMGSPPPASPAITQLPPCILTYVSLRYAFKIVITCLKMEKDWPVLHLVLKEIPTVLQNKSLVLSKQGNNEIDLLVNALCSMIIDKNLNLPESLNVKVNRAEFHSLVLFVLASLASYHAYLDNVHQQKMIRCLYKYGMSGPRCSRQSITALTTCTLEMKDVMVKMLPEVLLVLSKISATVHIAIPVLEFLSTLTQLPMVFANFVGDQYMAVFAISLPYTNPFRYNHYIVSLAHHVIAVWFLKCRLPFRKDFVKFITNGLQTNALIPFEETNFFKTDLSKLNQDSSDRKRSSSLTEQSSRRRERATTLTGRIEGKTTFDFHRPPQHRTLLTFYEELTETCIDLMARYTFSPCSALPRRLPTAEFLLSGGQSMTWIIDNKIITITTSGCSQKPLKRGICDKCWLMCKLDQQKTPENESKTMRAYRSGSNEADRAETSSSRVTRQNSGDKSSTNTSASSPVEETKKIADKLEQLPSKLQQLETSDSVQIEKQACACWCQSWAEIYIRRPTGDMSWVMRIQNQVSSQHAVNDFPINEISTLFMPSCLKNTQTSDEFESFENVEDNQEEEFASTSMPISIPGSPTKQSPSRQSSRDSIDEDVEYEDGSKSRNPVRRSNSSPEMSANWKNPFLQQKQERIYEDIRSSDEDCTKKNKNYSKDMRVSCEAIPEEIAGMGTTPPNDPLPTSKTEIKQENIEQSSSHHPSLLSCHSYPGTTLPSETSILPKLYQTVPPSPNVMYTSSSVTPGLYTSRATNLLRASKSESTESGSSEKSVFDNSSTSLSSKPPQSPTQTSPRLTRHSSIKEHRDGHEIQKSSSLVLEKNPLSLNISLAREKSKEKGSYEKLNQQDLSQSQKRDRGYTISVMSPVRKPRAEQLRQLNRTKEAPKSGINPSFVFLQLYHSASFGSTAEKPLLIDSSQVVQRALKILDLIPPYETHKIGVIYIRQGQCNNETEILLNTFGSVRYVEFLQRLGTLIKLQDVDPQVVFLGGLEQDGTDGTFAYIWQDDVIRVAFHVATLMPNKESDPNCNNKKSHIGNNYITIVYNDSDEEYNINTIKGQFNFASIIIQPLDHNTNKVTVKAKDELVELIGHSEPKIVSDQNVAILTRQLAIHANLASLVCNSLKTQSQDPYASNWLERLRKIKNVRNKVLQENKKDQNNPIDEAKARRGQMEDFTEYT